MAGAPVGDRRSHDRDAAAVARRLGHAAGPLATTDGCLDDDDCVFVFVHVDPASGLTLGRPERWVELTGHFGDPAAASCRGSVEIGDPVLSRDEAVEYCRQKFVATSVREIPAP